MLIVAKFRVAAKRAAQMEDLLRGLAAHIALEAAPEINSVAEEVIPVEAAAVAQPEEVATESKDNAARAPQEDESGKQELLRTGNEDGRREGKEPGEGVERNGAERADADEDGLVAGASGEVATAQQGGRHADQRQARAVLRKEGRGLTINHKR